MIPYSLSRIHPRARRATRGSVSASQGSYERAWGTHTAVQKLPSRMTPSVLSAVCVMSRILRGGACTRRGQKSKLQNVPGAHLSRPLFRVPLRFGRPFSHGRCTRAEFESPLRWLRLATGKRYEDRCMRQPSVRVDNEGNQFIAVDEECNRCFRV